MVKWILGVVGGILVLAAIGTGIALAVLPVTEERVESTPSPPLVPSDLSASYQESPAAIVLTWSDAIPSEVTAILQRSTSGNESDWQDLTTLSTDADSYVDVEFVPGTTYFYRIRASDSTGSSGISNPASITAGN